MRNLSLKLARTLIAFRYLLLGLAAICAAAAWLPAQRVRFDRSVENMFADDDPLLSPYRRLKQTFGGNEVVLAVYEDADLFHVDRSGLDRLAAIRERLDRVPGVQEVLTIDRPFGEAIVDPRSETAPRMRELFENYTHDAQGKTAAAVCMLAPSAVSREETVAALRGVIDSLPSGVGPNDGYETRLRLDGLEIRAILRAGKLRVVAGAEEQVVELDPEGDGEVVFNITAWPIERDGQIVETISSCRVSVRTEAQAELAFRVEREGTVRELKATFEPARCLVSIDGAERVARFDGAQIGGGSSGARLRAIVDGQNVELAAQPLPDRLPRGYLTGEPAMVVEGFRLLERDGDRLTLWSTVLLGATIILCFRSVWWVAIPVAVVHFALLLTNATFVWLGLELSMVSSMLTAIVTVIAVGMTVHVTVHFQEQRERGVEPHLALVTVFAWLLAPIFFSAATDVAGFASLTAAGVRPVQDFGVMMAIGAGYSGVAVILIVPALLTLARRPGDWLKRRSRIAFLDADPKSPWGQSGVDRHLRRLVGWSGRYPWIILAVTSALAVAAALGARRLEVETDFTRNFRRGNEIVRSYEFVESRLGGAGVLDAIVPAPAKLDWEYLSLVQRLERRLRSEVRVTEGVSVDERGRPALTKVLSLSDAVIAAAGDLDDRPGLLRGIKVDAALGAMKSRLPSFYAALYAPDSSASTASDGQERHALRIMLRAKERQGAEQKRQLIDEVQRIVDSELASDDWQTLLEDFPAQHRRGEVTGFFVLLTNLIDSMLSGQWAAFGVATLAIGLMSLVAMLSCDEAFVGRNEEGQRPEVGGSEVGDNVPRRKRGMGDYFAAFGRSLLLAIVAQAPNALPILLVLGAMGWLGLKINLGAVMISAVSMGLSIDMSLHYLISFRRLHAAGATVAEALAEVQKGVGRAMVFSTLALIVGFTTLCVSEFVPTVYFGALVSLSMVGGMFGNLLVLPMLIKIVVRERPAAASQAA